MMAHRGFLWTLTVSLALGSAAAAGDEKPAGAHGAFSTEQQLAALAELGLSEDGQSPPAHSDPVLYGALIPEDNAPTAERVALGRKLYFDARLSKDGTVSCATCHDVKRSFTDRRPVSEGIFGKLGRRNAPTTMNAAFLDLAFWDGRAKDIEEQATQPIVNPIEMGFEHGDAAAKAIAAIPEYEPLFQAAYGRPVGYEDIGRALAAFQRTLVFIDSPFMAALHGDATALDEAEVRGRVLYEGKARCASCHPLNATNPIGVDNQFHNIGVSARHQDFESLAKRALVVLAKDSSLEALDRIALETDLGELGRFVVTRDYADIGSFKTPQVVNTGITAPYMHDGSMQTLWDVVDHYNKGGEANSWLDGGIEPLALAENEIDDLVAFLFALTDRRFAALNAEEFARQKKIASESRPFRDDDLAHRRRDAFEARLKD
jgi:cytochrome c peroxidase